MNIQAIVIRQRSLQESQAVNLIKSTDYVNNKKRCLWLIKIKYRQCWKYNFVNKMS